MARPDIDLQRCASDQLARIRYRYDAFISYAHDAPDRSCAKWLHGALESFRIPRRLSLADGRRRLKAFCDDEVAGSTDLSDKIQQALRDSQFLIVVCSRNTPQSARVNAEIQAFNELGRDDQVFVLLVDGEPGTAFPMPLWQESEATSASNADLAGPLAADVRGAMGIRGRQKKRHARHKILALLLGCHYDELRRHESRRKTRRAGVYVLLAMMVLGLGGWLAAIAGSRANRRQEYERHLNAATETARQSPEQALEVLADASRFPTDLRDRRWSWLQDFCRPQRFEHGVVEPAAVATSRDANRYAIVTTRKLKIFPLDSTQPMEINGEFGSAAAISPDGRALAVARGDGFVDLVQPETGERLASFPSENIQTLEFSPNGSLLVGSAARGLGFDGETPSHLTMWECAEDYTTARKRFKKSDWQFDAFSADGSSFLAVSSNAGIALFDADRGREVKRIASTSSIAIALAPGGDKLALVDEDRNLHLWNLQLEDSSNVLSEKTNNVSAITFADAMPWLACSTWDGSVVLWDITSERIHRTLGNAAPGNGRHYTHPSQPFLSFLDEDRHLLVVRPDWRAQIWEVTTGNLLREYRIGEVRSCSVLDGGEFLLTQGTRTPNVQVWDVLRNLTPPAE